MSKRSDDDDERPDPLQAAMDFAEIAAFTSIAVMIITVIVQGLRR